MDLIDGHGAIPDGFILLLRLMLRVVPDVAVQRHDDGGVGRTQLGKECVGVGFQPTSAVRAENHIAVHVALAHAGNKDLPDAGVSLRGLQRKLLVPAGF